MAVAEAVAAEQPVSAQIVGNAFVQQYYHILYNSPGLVHKFYQDNSTFGRPEQDGSFSITTTMQVRYSDHVSAMAVAEAVAAEQPVSAQIVGNAFVQQYYHILYNSPGLVHKFYQDNSTFGRPEQDGSFSITTTMQAINEKIISLNYGGLKYEVKSVDSQESFNGGVHVLVTGSLTGEDNIVQNFAQSFFLAPQDKGYFVLNDMLRYVDGGIVYSALVSDDAAPPAPEPIPAPVEDSHVSEQSTPSPEGEVIEGEVFNPPENGDVPIAEEKAPVAAVVHKVHDNTELAVEASAKSSQVPKKSFASIVMRLKENAASFSPPPPAPKKGLHLVMFPFFAFGHISPFVHLSNKLSTLGVRISFLTPPGNVARIESMLNPSPTSRIIPLEMPSVPGLPPGSESTSELTPAQSELLKVAVDLMQPQIKTLLSTLKPHFVLFDFAQEWLPGMASELGIKTVFYSVFIALSTAFLTVPARLPEPKTYPNVEQVKYPPPGFPKTAVSSVETFVARDFLYMFKSFHGKPCVYDRVLSGLTSCSVILAKTCNEMEAPYIEYVKSQFEKPVLLVGPVVPQARPDPLDENWTEWLDRFEEKSVVFCSFGSETFLNKEQIRELVLGLELTGLPFFVVLNFPGNVEASEELRRALPDGFSERVDGRGVIATGWVQQQQILAHASVGCFVCHAGFSSVIEGIANGCQLVMVPQKGDQYLNSKLVSGDLRAGVEVKRRDEDGQFGKEDVRRAVETVMSGVDEEPGKSIRECHEKWRKFLVDEGAQDKMIRELVREMEAIAGPGTSTT